MLQNFLRNVRGANPYHFLSSLTCLSAELMTAALLLLFLRKRGDKMVPLFLLPMLIAPMVTSYPTGAPDSACDDMFPSGHGFSARNSPPPFKIEIAEGTFFQTGDFIPVTVRSTDGQPLNGLLLQARLKNASGQIVGQFCTKDLQKQRLQAVECRDNNPRSAITHTTRLHAENVTVYFYAQPSSGINGDIFFRATVVRARNNFWINLESPTLTLSTTNSNYSSTIKGQCFP